MCPKGSKGLLSKFVQKMVPGVAEFPEVYQTVYSQIRLGPTRFAVL